VTDARGTLPDFLIVGAMKAATSTLHEQLARQPGFFLATPKEPCFFSDDEVWARGLDWYRSLFAGAAAGDLRGESSTHYTKLPTYPRTVERMRAALPAHTRFIYVMRHPVDRLVSHYIHEWSTGTVDATIDAALAHHPALVAYGRYAWQLAPYLETFGAARVLPVFVSRLEARPQAVLDRVCRFLDYRGTPRWAADVARQNVSRERLREGRWRARARRAPGARRLWRTLVPRALRERINDRWRMTVRPRPSAAALARVREVFDRDLAELGGLLGMELSCAAFDAVTADVDPAWTPAAYALYRGETPSER
jgi:Sulfotransferase domain